MPAAPSDADPAYRIREAGIRAAILAQRLLVRLPWRAQRAIGAGLGALSYRAARRRRRIARRNLELCFPDLSEEEREQLLRAHFRALGIGIVELGLAWWAEDSRLRPLVVFEGLQHLDSLQGPVLLITGHSTCMDLICRLLGLEVEYDGVQRPFGYPTLDRELGRGRGRAASTVYSKFDLRGIIRALQSGRRLWMAVDQAQQSAHPVLAPFFGIPAPTTDSPARLAARCRASVVPVVGWREEDGTYRVRVEPPLEGFPGDDALADAARLNAVVENQVRIAPEQYYWIHRRFKTDPSPYDDL